jgi:hypothetical protein
MHSTGFEPVTFHRKTDYESGAFNHSATNANMELVGIEPTSIQNFLTYSFTGIVLKNGLLIEVILNYNKRKRLMIVK